MTALASAMQHRFNKPQLTLPIFDGNALNFFEFIKSFEHTVEKTVSDPYLRLCYLINSCNGDWKSSSPHSLLPWNGTQ